MPCLFDNLKDIIIPAFLITGEFDKKFSELNKEILKELAYAKHSIIKNAGHNTHIEKPAAFVKEVNQFLVEVNN